MPKSKPKQDRLLEMQDAAIQELEAAAIEYAEKRDERLAMLVSEVELKAELLAIMKRHKKQHYEHKDIVVDIVPEGEKVKVTIKKTKDDANEAA